jgi:N-acetylmuramoyl-L-alanine amidase
MRSQGRCRCYLTDLSRFHEFSWTANLGVLAGRRAGTLIPVHDALRVRGALLFRIDEGAGHDHVAISLGDGRTMEARGKDFGVNIFSTADRRWTHAGMIPGFSQADRELKKGDRGGDVRWVQRRLQVHGLEPGPADGVFGSRTDTAVRSFQRARDLGVDGIVGAKTREALGRSVHN